MIAPFRWYLSVRKFLARWWPDPVQGVGFHVVPDKNCIWTAELPLILDVEGRTGVVHLSWEMWVAVAVEAGWVSMADANKAWDEQIAAQLLQFKKAP